MRSETVGYEVIGNVHSSTARLGCHKAVAVSISALSIDSAPTQSYTGRRLQLPWTAVTGSAGIPVGCVIEGACRGKAQSVSEEQSWHT